MPVDTSMYGQLRPVEIENPLNALAKAAHVQGAVSQNRLAGLMFSEKQREADESRALGDEYKNALDPDGSLNRSRLLTGVAQKGLGSRIPGLQKTFADQDKSMLEAQKVQLETGLKRFEAVGQIMSGVKDQATYDAARQQAAQILGPEAAAKMPPSYDPAVIERNRMQALSVKDQLEQQWKSLDYKLNVDKFGEQKRHNQSTERVAAGNLGVAQANLGLSRERLALEKSAPKGQYDAERGLLVDPRTGVAMPVKGQDGQPIGGKDKLPEAQQKQVIGVQNLSNAISEYRKELAGYGGLKALSPDSRAAMGTKYNNMMLQAKEAYNLGVLNGPDLDILTAVITDPRSLQGAITSKSALDKQAAELDRIMQGVGQVASQSKPRVAAPAAASAKPAQVPAGGIKFLGFE